MSGAHSSPAYQRAWRAANPTLVQVYAARHAPKKAESRRARDKRLADKVARQKIEWRLANLERVRAVKAAYRKANATRIAAENAMRKAMRMRATAAWADPEKIHAFYEQARQLSESTGIPHHVDHIVPLKSQRVCGLHCEANLRVVTGSENLSKHNRLWPDMPEWSGE